MISSSSFLVLSSSSLSLWSPSSLIRKRKSFTSSEPSSPEIAGIVNRKLSQARFQWLSLVVWFYLRRVQLHVFSLGLGYCCGRGNGENDWQQRRLRNDLHELRWISILPNRDIPLSITTTRRGFVGLFVVTCSSCFELLL